MSDVSSISNLQRGAACSNCRRRKIRCDGIRPNCGQCRNRPPRSGDPCAYDQETTGSGHQTPAEMQQTIRRLQARIDELERTTGRTPSHLTLHHPYSAPASRSGTPQPNDFQEPSIEVRVQLINLFLDQFLDTGFMFLDPITFSEAALRPLPFGHGDRPAPALLGSVYLWACIRSPGQGSKDSFLRVAIQHLPVNANPSFNFAQYPILVLQAIQAHVLLSLYYLHEALPAQGRYHAAAAASLALTAGLHRLHAPSLVPQPPFALARAAPVFGQVPDTGITDAAMRVSAFWAVAIVNNCWVAAQGGPSSISYSTSVETPWPGGTRAGSTISKFLNGHDSDGFSSVAMLAKASTLMERVAAAGARISGLDPTTFNTLSQRLDVFYAVLPPLLRLVEADQALLVAHGLTLMAIIHLHAPPRGARVRLRAAADAISELLDIAIGRDDVDVHPIFGPVAAAAVSVYTNEVRALRPGSQEHRDAHESLERVVRAMRRWAPNSPIMRVCLQSVAAQE
ncbi:hypothetical protein C8F01DRAFT_1242738 [Mycena amicta]|nr:hypothetical protein C8F01DRAFT_1242738 [Mycena amicta]